MSDASVRNPHKILKLRAGVGDIGVGPDWVSVLASQLLPPGSNTADFFAPGLHNMIGLDNTTTFSLSTTADIKPAMEKILEKMQNSAIGRIARGIGQAAQAGQGLASGGEEGGQLMTAGRFVESLGLPPNARYQTELSLIPAWNGTSEVRLESITFTFQMGMTGLWDARREVYNPVIALAAANLPTRTGARLTGPLPTQEFIVGTVLGALARSVGSNENPYNIESRVTAAMESAERGAFNEYYSGQWTGIWSAELGRMRLPDFYVTNTSHSFSTDTDESGFPISGTVTWGEIKSIKMAHRGLPLYRLYGPGGRQGSVAATSSNTSDVDEGVVIGGGSGTPSFLTQA